MQEGNEAAGPYRLRWRGEVRGGFTATQVQAMLAAGQITRFHQVSCAGQAWRQVQDCPELLAPDSGSPPSATASAGSRERAAAAPTESTGARLSLRPTPRPAGPCRG